MTPYYEHGGITIYHGDCREFLAETRPTFDLLLTDPPYGIGSWSATGGNSLKQAEVDKINNWDLLPSDNTIRLAVKSSKQAVVWGGNYFLHILGSCRSPLIWDKGIRGMHYADGEMAWTNFDYATLRIFNLTHQASGLHGKRQHPTQKPEQLITWCINQVRPSPMTVFDPFMGSGTTLVAAKQLGRKAVGIELEEKYCEIAAKRLSVEYLFTQDDEQQIIQPSFDTEKM